LATIEKYIDNAREEAMACADPIRAVALRLIGYAVAAPSAANMDDLVSCSVSRYGRGRVNHT
jgi:hypothetical protein